MKFFIRFLFIIAVSFFGVISAGAEPFGHVAVIVDKATNLDLAGARIQVEGEKYGMALDGQREIMLWNLTPGRQIIQLIFPDERPTVSIELIVYPGVTSRVRIIQDGKQLVMHSEGIADQAGHVLFFDRETIGAFPGEINDGLGLFDIHTYDSNVYNYDGLSISEVSRVGPFNASGKTYPDYALINLTDPFAGYKTGISLISDFDGPEKMGFEGVYASRERRFYRLTGRLALPRGVGSVFGALNFEDLTDAAPRRNVDEVLSHNQADDFEIMSGAGVSVVSGFKADARMFYKRYQRDYYDIDYYYNIEHAPREEVDIYGGQVRLYGWLPNDWFVKAGFGLFGDDSKKGDGVYFDDIEAYVRPDGNPRTDRTGLFWFWDDIDSVTTGIDESHVYDDYNRYKTTGKRFALGIEKTFDINRLSLDIGYRVSEFRWYRNLFPTLPMNESIINIGYDSLGVEENDQNYFDEVPRPRQLDMTLGFNRISDDYFIKAAVDYIRFDPDALALIDSLNPFGAGGLPFRLEKSDMREATAKSELGYRLACGVNVLKNRRIDLAQLFFSVSKQYSPAPFSLLYSDYDYMEFHISSLAYPFVFGNPDLELQDTFRFEIGSRLKTGNHALTLSFSREAQKYLIDITNLPAFPRAYAIYLNTGQEPIANTLMLTYQMTGPQFVNAALTAVYNWYDKSYAAGSNIAWTISETATIVPGESTGYILAGGISLRPAFLMNDYDPTAPYRAPSIWHNIIARTKWDFSFNYRSGIRYTPISPDVDPISLGPVSYTPVGSVGSREGKDFFEMNVGVSARILDFAGAALSVRFEVLNVFDRDNHLDVYRTTGEPDNTGWLNTEPGQAWAEDGRWILPHDASGLTGTEKYLLKQNDPNNFGRPRMFRLLARLEF